MRRNGAELRSLTAAQLKLLIKNSISPQPLHKTLTLLDALEHHRDNNVYQHYNTFWTSQNVSLEMIGRLCELPNLVGLKWAVPTANFMESEQVISRFAERLCIIDNQLRFVTSHILGARGIEVHICNYWPQWGVRLWNLLENREYVEAQKELVGVAMPFYTLWKEMMQYTGGDGYLDKLCMELVGLPSSRCRPPTRDVRDKFRERARQMLIESGVPGIVGTHAQEETARRAS